MDLTKSIDFFDPARVNSKQIHIIGCGSVGSTLAENLARCGVTNFVLWDFDVVMRHNIVNQMFRAKDVGKLKVDALKEIILEINPEIEDRIVLKPNGWQGENLSGYVFLAVDSIEIRQKIVDRIYNNALVEAVFDFRTGLTSAQHFAANWRDLKQRKSLRESMNFTHADAAQSNPTTACGVTIGVAPTVRNICAAGVSNFINLIKREGFKTLVMQDSFNFFSDAM